MDFVFNGVNILLLSWIDFIEDGSAEDRLCVSVAKIEKTDNH